MISEALERALAGRWIAGPHIEDALERSRSFNSKCISTLINFLGESIQERAEVRNAVETYLLLIDEISKTKTKAAISVKPTQLGLCISGKAFNSNYMKLARFARENGVFVWLDMEEPAYVDDTIAAYRKAVRFGNTGICIQSYLKRSMGDIKSMQGIGAKIRLVKGAYGLDQEYAFKSKQEVSHNYLQLMYLLFRDFNDFMIATHDHRIDDIAMRLNVRDRKRMTFAMLNGIRNQYARYLVSRRQKVAIYVPFGNDWIRYGYRRLTEAGHLSLVIRSMLQSQEI